MSRMMEQIVAGILTNRGDNLKYVERDSAEEEAMEVLVARLAQRIQDGLQVIAKEKRFDSESQLGLLGAAAQGLLSRDSDMLKMSQNFSIKQGQIKDMFWYFALSCYLIAAEVDKALNGR